ncbi:olfactory receptor 2AT4-like [Aulostomus maculatus]
MLMDDKNATTIKYFIITGFTALEPIYYGPVSAVFFILYLVILIGNIFILAFVGFERRLHKPTYQIFCNLAMNDVLFGTVTLPRIISRYWWDDKITSLGACFTQMYFVHALGAINSLLLLIMALDRFAAVCLPLKYPVLITNNSIFIACGLSWTVTFFRMMGVVLHALTLSYCESNVILQCYCDHISITRLASGGDIQYVKTIALIQAMLSLLVPISLIICSYACIFVVVLRMSNVEGRHKILSTCSPQLFISGLYYLPRCFVYLANFVGYSFSLDVRMLLILLYSLLPCAINPFIYCFKTKDIKEILMRKFKTAKVAFR